MSGMRRGYADGAPGPGPAAGDDRWDVIHGSRSVAASAFSAGALLLAEWLDSSSTFPVLAALAVPFYFCMALWFRALTRRRFRKREAPLPRDKSGGGRLALAVAAMVFALAGDLAAERSAVWLAMAAVTLGSMADGIWLALVSERRGLGFWRSWSLLAREREARRLYWALLFGEARR